MQGTGCPALAGDGLFVSASSRRRGPAARAPSGQGSRKKREATRRRRANCFAMSRPRVEASKKVRFHGGVAGSVFRWHPSRAAERPGLSTSQQPPFGAGANARTDGESPIRLGPRNHPDARTRARPAGSQVRDGAGSTNCPPLSEGTTVTGINPEAPQPRQIRFNAFDMNCVAHQSSGMWRHPDDRSGDYKDLELLDRPGPAARARHLRRRSSSPTCSAPTTSTAAPTRPRSATAPRCPVNDPMLLVSAMAAGHRAPRLRRHRRHRLRAPVPVRPPHVARSTTSPRAASAGTSSPATCPPPPATWATTTSSSTTSATTTPTSTSRCSTSCGRARGRTTRSSATASPASSPTRPRCTRSATTARTSRCPASTSPSRRRSAPR